MKILERRKLWFIISLLLLLPGLISLFTWKLNLGIDFKGGSLAEYRLEIGEADDAKRETSQKQGSESIKKIYSEEGVGEPIVQTDTTNREIRYLVKSKAVESGKRTNIVRRLSEAETKLTELSFETIDPQVGADVTRKAFWAIGVASLAIIIYISLSFRGIPKPTSSVQFGISAVIALLHDVLFIVGFFSLMGHYYGWEVNAEFVTATLTVMGFSVHDTIVTFDRLRENLKKNPSTPFRLTANASITQTLTRSLNTSITVILVLFSVVLLGGTTIRTFATTLLVGIAVGTYSSIFVATALLDWWHDVSPRIAKLKRFKRRSRH